MTKHGGTKLSARTAGSIETPNTFSSSQHSHSSTFNINWRADVFPFNRLILLLTFSLLKDDMMRVAVIFFLVRSTNDCHYKEHVGSLIVFVAISQILTFPLLAYISDFNSKHVATVVMATAALELILETLMICDVSGSVAQITLLFSVRQLLRTVNTSSMFKMLKLKLLCWLRASYSNTMEQRYFQTICMTVITLVSVSNVVFWCIVFSLGLEHVTGYHIEDFLWVSTLICSMLAVILSCAMTAGYIKRTKPLTSTGCYDLERIRLSQLYGDHRHRLVIIADVEEKVNAEEMSTDCEYIGRGLNHIYRNHLCFHSLVSSIYIMLFLTICENVFPLFFAMKNSNLRAATILNLCGGSIQLVVQYQIIGHFLYFGGSLFFLYFTQTIRPKIYFRRFIPAFCYLSIVLLIPLYFYKMLRVLDNVLVSFFTVIPELLVRYNLFHSTACIDQQFVGLVSCIHSNLLTAAPLLSGLLLSLSMPLPIILSVAVCFLLMTSVHSRSFAAKYF